MDQAEQLRNIIKKQNNFKVDIKTINKHKKD